eukprot:scaffold2774_cov105-Pinguiococcus_pyrenoidosus.AAC.1
MAVAQPAASEPEMPATPGRDSCPDVMFLTVRKSSKSSEAVTDERKVPAAAKAARPSSAASSLSDTMSESDESFRPRSQTKRPTDGRRSEPTVDDGCSGDASLEDSTVDDVTL